jgi:hypothetical protein
MCFLRMARMSYRIGASHLPGKFNDNKRSGRAALVTLSIDEKKGKYSYQVIR